MGSVASLSVTAPGQGATQRVVEAVPGWTVQRVSNANVHRGDALIRRARGEVEVKDPSLWRRFATRGVEAHDS